MIGGARRGCPLPRFLLPIALVDLALLFRMLLVPLPLISIVLILCFAGHPRWFLLTVSLPYGCHRITSVLDTIVPLMGL